MAESPPSIDQFYKDQKSQDSWASDAIKALQTGRITKFSNLPEIHIEPDLLIELREDPDTLNKYHAEQVEEHTGDILKEVRDVIETEARYLILHEAAEMFGTEKGETHKAFTARIGLNIQDSRARLTTLTLFIEQMELESEDDPNAITKAIVKMREAHFDTYLADLRGGSDYNQIHEFLRESAAWGYLKVSHAYYASIAANTVIQVLRLTTDPTVIKGDKSMAIIENITSDREKANLMVSLARQVLPTMETISDARPNEKPRLS